MPRALFATFVLFVLPGAPRLASQTRSQPNLTLSVELGFHGGYKLWSVGNQPFYMIVQTGAGIDTVSKFDTLDLRRQLVPGFTLGVSGVYYPTPYVGIHGELVFYGMSLESHCAIRTDASSDSTDIDPQLCSSLEGQSVSTSTLGLAIGTVLRPAPRGAISPYLRADVGVVTRSRGTVELIGLYTDNTGFVSALQVAGDNKETKNSLSFSVALGVAMPLGPGYQFRLEGGDVYAPLDRVTGLAAPTNVTLFPPHAAVWKHNLTFRMALDIVLEQRRGRRY
ncbi:MAG TPA: hypothetical protein VFK78_08195 [Gemmatimonadales bacterium]|nr:hypothetical protein [Gemmatimonadales bacterium]